MSALASEEKTARKLSRSTRLTWRWCCSRERWRPPFIVETPVTISASWTLNRRMVYCISNSWCDLMDRKAAKSSMLPPSNMFSRRGSMRPLRPVMSVGWKNGSWLTYCQQDMVGVGLPS